MSDDTTKKDITRIEDMSEFLHEEDEAEFETNFDEPSAEESLEEDVLEEFPPAFPLDNQEEFSEEKEPEEEEKVEEEEEFETAFGEEFSDSSFEDQADDTEVSINEEGPELEEESFLSMEPESEPEAETESEFESNSDFDDEISINEEINTPEEEQEQEQESHEDTGTKTPLPYLNEEIEEESQTESHSPTFGDVHAFTQNMTFGNLATEGNPPYSLVIKNIKYKEDIEGILEVLTVHELIKESEQEETRKSLSRGRFLISRVSEFAAIILCHKLRVFDVDILVGLSEQIHPLKDVHTGVDAGIVSKRNIYQNYNHQFELSKDELNINNIMVTTLSHFDGYEIKEHLGLVTEHYTIDSDMIEFDEQDPINEDFIDPESLLQNEGESEEALPQIYQTLTQRLKLQALEKKGNAIIGVSFALTPLIAKTVSSSQKYKITITGNVIIVIKAED